MMKRVEIALSFIGHTPDTLNRDTIYKNFVDVHLQQVNEGCMQPNNLCQYILALEHFTNFLLHIEHPCTADKRFATLQKSLPHWRSSLGKRCKENIVIRQARDFRERLRLKDVHKYMNSANANKATRTLQNAARSSYVLTPTESTFLLVRDFLFVKLACSNGLRSGSLCNFKFLHFNGATKDTHGNVVYKVPEHKTAVCHGASEITMMADVHELFLGYVKLRRLMTPSRCQPQDYVFITSPFHPKNRASQITSCTVSHGLTTQFKSIGYPYRVSTRKIRKLIATNVTSKTPQNADAVASHMKHSVATQRKHYILHEKDTEAIKATRAIRDALGLSPNVDVIQIADDTRSPPKLNNVLADERNNFDDISTDENENIADIEPRSKGKKILSNETKLKIKNDFSQNILKGKHVKKDDVAVYLNNNLNLKATIALESKRNETGIVMAVYHFLRWVINKKIAASSKKTK